MAEQDKLWNSFYQLIGGEVRLKSLRPIISYLLDFIERPTASSKDIAKIISADPSLSAKVLTVVNSPAMGLRSKVSDLSYAITLLGYNQIRDIVLSVSIIDKMGKKQEERFVSLWKHSFYTGKACEIIAQNIGKPGGEAFTVGLLHDIGLIILAYSNSVAFSTSLNNYKHYGGKIDYWQSEKQTLGMSHAEIGGLAVAYWRMPETIHEAIWNHHAPRAAPLKSQGEIMAQIVFTADVLSEVLGFPAISEATIAGCSSRKPENCVHESYLAPLGLTRTRFQEIAFKVKDTFEKSETIFQWLEASKGKTRTA